MTNSLAHSQRCIAMGAGTVIRNLALRQGY